jgi:NADH:ubiquinone oxidoreductase subunit 6 (subunit J)
MRIPWTAGVAGVVVVVGAVGVVVARVVVGVVVGVADSSSGRRTRNRMTATIRPAAARDQLAARDMSSERG